MPLIIIYCVLLAFWCFCVFGAITVAAWVPFAALAGMLVILGWKIMGPLIKG